MGIVPFQVLRVDWLGQKRYHSCVNKIQKVRSEIMSLSASERASLAHDLILSLDDPADYELSPAQESEIQRRISMVREGTASGRRAAAVFDGIRAKYP